MRGAGGLRAPTWCEDPAQTLPCSPRGPVHVDLGGIVPGEPVPLPCSLRPLQFCTSSWRTQKAAKTGAGTQEMATAPWRRSAQSCGKSFACQICKVTPTTTHLHTVCFPKTLQHPQTGEASEAQAIPVFLGSQQDLNTCPSLDGQGTRWLLGGCRWHCLSFRGWGVQDLPQGLDGEWDQVLLGC